MPPDGTCPTCKRSLAKAPTAAPPAGEFPDDGSGEQPAGAPTTLNSAQLREMAGEDAKAPWHFKLMVLALALYLGWRAVQLVLLLFR
jgi:hypothetical protein